MEAQTVPPCETLHLLVQRSKTHTTQLQNPSSVPLLCPWVPCLRVKPAPVSTVISRRGAEFFGAMAWALLLSLRRAGLTGSLLFYYFSATTRF